MSAQMSSGAGGDGKKPEKKPCARCGNLHQGPCFPSCSTCGKVHKGVCRYVNTVPSIAARGEPSQIGMTALYGAQQAGQQLGYQQAYNEMRSLGMGPMMGPMMGPAIGPIGGPAMGGQFVSPMGGFGSFGAMGNPGWAAPAWGNQIPGQFGQVQGGPPVLTMGQVFEASNDGTSRGASVRHSARGAARGSRGGRTQSGRPKDRKEEKAPLAPTNAGIGKPVSKSAKYRARRKAKKQVQDTLAGPIDPHLLSLLAEPKVTDAGDMILDDVQPPTGVEEDPGDVDADSMIKQAMNRIASWVSSSLLRRMAPP